MRCGKDCLGLGHGAQVQLPTWRRISAAWQGPDLMLAGLVTCLAYALLSDVRVWLFFVATGVLLVKGWDGSGIITARLQKDRVMDEN